MKQAIQKHIGVRAAPINQRCVSVLDPSVFLEQDNWPVFGSVNARHSRNFIDCVSLRYRNYHGRSAVLT